MKASIKKDVSLPEPKLPTTKPVRDDRFYSYGNRTVYKTPSRLDGMTGAYVRSESDDMKKLYDRRRKKSNERWTKVFELTMTGKSNREIAMELGYSEKTVEGIIYRIRKNGGKIPERKRGPK